MNRLPSVGNRVRLKHLPGILATLGALLGVAIIVAANMMPAQATPDKTTITATTASGATAAPTTASDGAATPAALSVTTAAPTTASVGTATPAAPFRFGMGADSIGPQTTAGAKPDYATFWVGPWTLTSGWSGPDAQLDSMKAAGITPAIHFYYWGDDISQACIENGCWSTLHNAQKDKAHWQLLAEELVDHLNAKMGGTPAVIFVETEFNKGGVDTYEPLDGYLAEKANFLHQGYPAAKIVMPLGNWNGLAWSTFDRFAAASDYVGLQGMRGSTRDSLSSYTSVYNATLAGTKTLHGLFGKPILLDDLALSSYPEPTYLEHQADSLKQFFTGMTALKAEGVTGIIYRSWLDDPTMNLANYYGEAERHWGFAHASSAGGAVKSAAQVWIDGVQAERAGAPYPTSSASLFTATFTPTNTTNNWWIETAVSSSATISKVEARENGGAWTVLPATSWGTYAKSFNVPDGHRVEFRATTSSGATATSSAYTWG